MADATLERPLPQNTDAERSVLGAILLDNHALNTAIEKLKPEDFFSDPHRRIFNHMIQLGEAQQAIDLVTLTDQLRRKGELDAVGGAAYVAQLVDGVPRVSNLEHYARIIKEKSLLRSLIYATHTIQQTALDAEDDADALLDRAESSIFQIAEDRIRTGLVSMKDVVHDNMERLERVIMEGKRVTGLATNYAQLDSLTSGLQPSELIILAARPSVGKTALALNIAENVALHQQGSVAIFSLEMSKESLLMRLLASLARVDAHRFRTGHLRREDWKEMTQALAQLSVSPLWIDDSGSATVTEIGAKARRMKRDRGLSSGNRGLPAADCRPWAVFESQRRGLQYYAGAEGACKRTQGSGAGTEPAYARAGTRRAQPATRRPAGIRRHRARCRCGALHSPAESFQEEGRSHRRRARADRTENRQAAERSRGQHSVCVSR